MSWYVNGRTGRRDWSREDPEKRGLEEEGPGKGRTGRRLGDERTRRETRRQGDESTPRWEDCEMRTEDERQEMKGFGRFSLEDEPTWKGEDGI